MLAALSRLLGRIVSDGGDEEVFIGSAFNDFIVGDSTATLLIGGAGNDTLAAGSGALQGESGNDTLIGLRSGKTVYADYSPSGVAGKRMFGVASGTEFFAMVPAESLEEFLG